MAVTLGVGPVTGGLPASTASSFTLTLTGTTAGRSIVVGLVWTPTGSFTDVTSVACSGESNLTLHGSTVTQPTTGRKIRVASLASITTGGDKTITVTIDASVNAQNYCTAYAVEFAGGDTSSFFDALASATGNGTNCTVNVTSANANALLIGVSVNDWADPTAGSGFTITQLPDAAQHGAAEYKLDAGAAGSQTVNFGTNASSKWAVIGAAFNALPGSPTRVPATGTLSLAGLAPSVGATYTVIPATGALAIDGYVPMASGSGNPEIAPAVGALSLTGYAPTVGATYFVPPDVGALSMTGYAPTLAVADIWWDGESDLLLHTISASAENDNTLGSTEITLGIHTVDSQAVNGDLGSAALDLLLPELEAGGNHGGEIDLLAHTIDGQGLSGGTASADIALLVYTVDAGAIAENRGTAGIVLLLSALTTAGFPEGVGTLAEDLASWSLDAAAGTGTVGTADLTVLIYDLTTVGFASGAATAEITALIASVESAGLTGLAETYRTWVLNLRNAALSEYTDFEFNSLTEFNGAVLAAGPSGIRVVGAADTDAGTAINARVRTGAPDFGSSWLKRVPRLYVTGVFPGNMYFRTLAERDSWRTYVLPANGEDGHQQRRVPVGKGPKSVNWQFEAENIEGSDFRLDRIIAYPLELRRRVQ